MTRTITFGGILLALELATLLLAGIIPGVELTLYALSSFYVAVLILQTSPKAGFLFYGASLILAILVLPNKIVLIPYGCFFGLYGIFKFYIETIRIQWVEIVLKLVFFNGSFLISFLLFRQLFLGAITLPSISVGFIAVGAEAMFLLYDAMFTLAIAYAKKRLPKG